MPPYVTQKTNVNDGTSSLSPSLLSSCLRSRSPPNPPLSLLSSNTSTHDTQRTLDSFMSSSGRHTLHRRRSHSASSPLTALRHFAGDKWRPSHKRARQSSTHNLASKDAPVDDAADWGRDGKRARRESSVRPHRLCPLRARTYRTR